MKIFADDVAMYCPVHSGDDCKAFQHDLNLVSTWCSKWQMRLNVSKCELLCISNKRSPVRPAYYINNCHLQWASSVKYLGVVVDSKLSWNDHISHISSKASKTLNLLRRHMFTCHASSKHKAFRALVLPILDYASTIVVLGGFVGVDLILMLALGQGPPVTVVVSFSGHLFPTVEGISL